MKVERAAVHSMMLVTTTNINEYGENGMPRDTMTQADWLDKVLARTDTDVLRTLVSKVLHEIMEVEVEQQTGAELGERSESRKTHRNGYRDRPWKTRVGDIDLKIPRVREGSYFPSFLEPRRRVEQALILAIREAYVQGVSTRRVEQLCQQLGVHGIDKSFVSRITKTLDEEVRAFTERKLEDEFPYVYVDARYEKVRRNRHIVSVAFLVAIGVRRNGTREVLGFRTSLKEKVCDATPCPVEIATGATRFTFELARYDPLTKAVDVARGMAPIVVDLVATFSRLTVESEPSRVAVRLGDESAGVTPLTVERDPGPVRVEVGDAVYASVGVLCLNTNARHHGS